MTSPASHSSLLSPTALTAAVVMANPEPPPSQRALWALVDHILHHAPDAAQPAPSDWAAAYRSLPWSAMPPDQALLTVAMSLNPHLIRHCPLPWWSTPSDPSTKSPTFAEKHIKDHRPSALAATPFTGNATLDLVLGHHHTLMEMLPIDKKSAGERLEQRRQTWWEAVAPTITAQQCVTLNDGREHPLLPVLIEQSPYMLSATVSKMIAHLVALTPQTPSLATQVMQAWARTLVTWESEPHRLEMEALLADTIPSVLATPPDWLHMVQLGEDRQASLAMAWCRAMLSLSSATFTTTDVSSWSAPAMQAWSQQSIADKERDVQWLIDDITWNIHAWRSAWSSSPAHPTAMITRLLANEPLVFQTNMLNRILENMLTSPRLKGLPKSARQSQMDVTNATRELHRLLHDPVLAPAWNRDTVLLITQWMENMFEHDHPHDLDFQKMCSVVKSLASLDPITPMHEHVQALAQHMQSIVEAHPHPSLAPEEQEVEDDLDDFFANLESQLSPSVPSLRNQWLLAIATHTAIVQSRQSPKTSPPRKM